MVGHTVWVLGEILIILQKVEKRQIQGWKDLNKEGIKCKMKILHFMN